VQNVQGRVEKTARRLDKRGVEMKKILCPTRGGEESYPNQDKAVQIASARGWEIMFLYVSNVDFLQNLRTPRMVQNLQDDMEDMGGFLLTMAQERAKKQHVEAKICLKRGVFHQALSEVIKDQEITTLFLGSSGEDQGVTTTGYLSDLVDKLRGKYSSLEIIIAMNGEIIRHVGGDAFEI
jgi:hypothetical protein